MDGRMVVVVTARLAGGDPYEEVWAAAVDDDAQAEAAVRKAAACTPDQATIVRGKINQTNLDGLSLRPGECKAWLG